MIEITAIRQESGKEHEHITDVQWRNTATSATGQSTRQTIVDWLNESKANQAVVANGSQWVYVGVVQPENGPPYIRTHADGEWSDNLIALPPF
jgi:hypothetical protein